MLNFQAEPDPVLVFRQSSQEGKGLIEMVVLISMSSMMISLRITHTTAAHLEPLVSLEGWCCSHQKTKLEHPAAC